MRRQLRPRPGRANAANGRHQAVPLAPAPRQQRGRRQQLRPRPAPNVNAGQPQPQPNPPAPVVQPPVPGPAPALQNLNLFPHRDPPVFRGSPQEDVVEWLFRFQQIAQLNQWNPEQQLRNIGMSFEGSAQKWHWNVMSRPVPPVTFDALKEELLRAFKPVNYEDHLELKLRSRKQCVDESFNDYFHDVVYMCGKIDPGMTERSKVQHLMRGLPSATIKAIYRFITPASNANDLFAQVHVYLQGEAMAMRQEIPPAAPPIGPPPSTSYHRQEKVANRNRWTPDGRPICNRCDEVGHVGRDCYSTPE